MLSTLQTLHVFQNFKWERYETVEQLAKSSSAALKPYRDFECLIVFQHVLTTTCCKVVWAEPEVPSMHAKWLATVRSGECPLHYLRV